MRTIEQIKVEPQPPRPGYYPDQIATHPAFAQIRAGRVSGHTALYGSEFHHQNYVTVTICRSELHRSLSNDQFVGKEELIEVAMSEAQWATFVSSPSVGMGVQCTLSHVAREMVPGLPDPQPRADQFGRELAQKQETAVRALNGLRDAIVACGLSKKKAADLAGLVDSAIRDITSNSAFVAEQFGEHMEHVKEDARAELHAYALGVMNKVNAARIESGATPLPPQPPISMENGN
jgi:hypothetical protein